MKFHIRPVLDEDGGVLAELHRSAILSSGLEFYALDQLESWAAGLRPEGYANARKDGEVIDVAVNHDDVPIAFCGRRELGVVGLFVHPDYQGRKIGSTLLKRAEKALFSEGKSELRVDASLSAVSFYQEHGYQISKTLTFKSRGGRILEMAHLKKVFDHK